MIEKVLGREIDLISYGGLKPIAAFFGEWSARQVWAPGTVLAMSLAARSVPFAAKPMRQIRRSDVEVWIKSMDAAGLAPGTIKTRCVNVRSVFRAAVALKQRFRSRRPRMLGCS